MSTATVEHLARSILRQFDESGYGTDLADRFTPPVRATDAHALALGLLDALSEVDALRSCLARALDGWDRRAEFDGMWWAEDGRKHQPMTDAERQVMGG